MSYVGDTITTYVEVNYTNYMRLELAITACLLNLHIVYLPSIFSHCSNWKGVHISHKSQILILPINWKFPNLKESHQSKYIISLKYYALEMTKYSFKCTFKSMQKWSLKCLSHTCICIYWFALYQITYKERFIPTRLLY